MDVSFGYAYDDNGNITDKIFRHRTSSPVNDYTYDDLNRVQTASYRSTGTETFNMDILGNRTSVADTRDSSTVNFAVDTPNLNNEYLTVGGVSVGHDNNGNLTKDHRGYYYEYDYENRITRVYKMDGALQVDIAEYTYDALGRRVEVVNFADVAAGGRTYQYYYDGQRAVYEDVYTGLAADSANHAYALYTVFGNYIDEVLVMNDGTEDFYYAHDHLYSTVALYKIVSGDFALAERYEYDAYGKATIMDGSYVVQTTSAAGNPYTFTGRRLDVLDGGNHQFMYYRARYLDVETGRFMQRDPLEYIDSMSLYQYVQSSPIANLDFLGMCKLGACEVQIDHFSLLGMSFGIRQALASPESWLDFEIGNIDDLEGESGVIEEFLEEVGDKIPKKVLKALLKGFLGKGLTKTLKFRLNNLFATLSSAQELTFDKMRLDVMFEVSYDYRKCISKCDWGLKTSFPWIVRVANGTKWGPWESGGPEEQQITILESSLSEVGANDPYFILNQSNVGDLISIAMDFLSDAGNKLTDLNSVESKLESEIKEQVCN